MSPKNAYGQTFAFAHSSDARIAFLQTAKNCGASLRRADEDICPYAGQGVAFEMKLGLGRGGQRRVCGLSFCRGRRS
jgi:hypothetical protein